MTRGRVFKTDVHWELVIRQVSAAVQVYPPFGWSDIITLAFEDAIIWVEEQRLAQAWLLHQREFGSDAPVLPLHPCPRGGACLPISSVLPAEVEKWLLSVLCSQPGSLRPPRATEFEVLSAFLGRSSNSNLHKAARRSRLTFFRLSFSNHLPSPLFPLVLYVFAASPP